MRLPLYDARGALSLFIAVTPSLEIGVVTTVGTI